MHLRTLTDQELLNLVESMSILTDKESELAKRLHQAVYNESADNYYRNTLESCVRHRPL